MKLNLSMKGRIRERFVVIKENILLFGGIFAGLAFLAFLLHLTFLQRLKSSINKTVSKWSVAYNLNDEQAKRIWEIEYEFHKVDSPIIFHSPYTESDMLKHYRELASNMPPADAERFLLTMKKHGERK